MERNDIIFNRIAEALLCDYSSVYYVNAVTNEYITYSLDPQHKTLKVEYHGKDFFKQVIPDAERSVFDGDRNIFEEDIQKENLLRASKEGVMLQWRYRLMINGKMEYHQLRMIRGVKDEDEYFILGVTNIDREIKMRQEAEAMERERMIYNQIAQSLAEKYDTIYYVDAYTDVYIEFSASEPYRKLGIPKSGSDFFYESEHNLRKYAHPEDTESVLEFIDKENIIEKLKKDRFCDTVYRLHIDGGYKYTKLSIMWANDQQHIIIGIEDIDEQVRRENQYELELQSANERALTDRLTGIKNKNAYQDMEQILQKGIDSGQWQPFGLLVCDLNDLKKVNDTFGHKAGDDYIRTACHMICVIFTHSPVYRVGGDEFVVLLKGNDFTDREQLISKLQERVEQNMSKEKAPVIAAGFAEFDPDKHSRICEVFELADSRMYENKRTMKNKRR